MPKILDPNASIFAKQKTLFKEAEKGNQSSFHHLNSNSNNGNPFIQIMQSSVKYLSDSYGLENNKAALYNYLKEEIDNTPTGYFPNPLQYENCIHIVNNEHSNLPVVVLGSLDSVVGEELYSTCYPKSQEGIHW